MRYLLIIIITCLFFAPKTTNAQLPAACNGTASAIACDITCISCNFNGFSGSTEGYPSGVAPEFCGTVENVQWLGFIAGATSAKFIITPTNCVNGDGVQVALYTDCMLPPLACDKGEMGGANLPVSIDVPMTIGENYYLLVDGYAGDQCQFTVTVDPPNAVFEPPLGVAQIVTGPAELCPNVTAEYQVQPVSGAAAYIWTGPPGTLFDSMPSPATILGSAGLSVDVTIGSVGGQICVQAANACNVNPPCSASTSVTILGDSDRPQIIADTVASLPCYDGAVPLEVQVTPNANTDFVWAVTDSVGSISGNTNTLRVLVDSVGQYTLVATNIFTGCSSTIQIRVTEPVLPDSADIRITSVRCYGEKNGGIDIDEVFSGNGPYIYALNGEAFRQSNRFGNLPAGNYDLLVQDALGCEFDTTITVPQPDELLVMLPADTLIELGQMLVLWDSSNVNYPQRPIHWDFIRPNIGDTTDCAGCLVMPIQAFQYALEVVDSNGCRAKDERTIEMNTPWRTYVPNVFAPGSTGNGEFGPYGGQDVVVFRNFQVFDRWGQRMHERKEITPNDTKQFWDGRIRNRLAPPGVYTYRLETVYKDGDVILYTGDVTLVR
jgi:hypothetical protein